MVPAYTGAQEAQKEVGLLSHLIMQGNVCLFLKCHHRKLKLAYSEMVFKNAEKDSCAVKNVHGRPTGRDAEQ